VNPRGNHAKGRISDASKRCCANTAASCSSSQGIYARDTHDRDDLAQEIAAQLWRSFGAIDELRAKFT
jgi:hypothetical protein